jgi:hypothetical protein
MNDNHKNHNTISSEDYIKKQRKQAEDLLHRLHILKQRAEHHNSILSCYRDEFSKCYQNSMKKLESFEVVKQEMTQWKDNLITSLSEKREKQIRVLDDALSDDRIDLSHLVIKLPKVTIFKLHENYPQKVKELTPAIVYTFSTSHMQKQTRSRPSSFLTTEINYDSASSKESSESNLSLHVPSSSQRRLSADLYRSRAFAHSSNRDIPYIEVNDSYGVPRSSQLQKKSPLGRPAVKRSNSTNVYYGEINESYDEPGRSQLTPPSSSQKNSLAPKSRPYKRSSTIDSYYDEIDSYYEPEQLSHSKIPSSPQQASLAPIKPTAYRHSCNFDSHYDEIEEPAEQLSRSHLNLNLPPSPQKKSSKPVDGNDINHSRLKLLSKKKSSSFATSMSPDAPPPPLPKRTNYYEDMQQSGLDEDNIYEQIPGTPMFETAINPSNIIINSRLAETPQDFVVLEGVCTTSLGIIIFSDPANNCLRILLDVKRKLRQNIKKGSCPGTVAYDESHHKIFVAMNDHICQLESDGARFKKFKQKELIKGVNPKGIACSTVQHKKNLSSMYIISWSPCSNEKLIYHYSCDGKFLLKISTRCIEKSPFAIDCKKEYLVVSTLEDGCLVKISTTGNPLWDEKVDARKPGTLAQPFDLVILPNEYIAVTECDAHRISIFSDAGKLVMRFGGEGSEPGNFKNPKGIAVLMSKDLVVVDSGNNRIQVFTLKSLGMTIPR